MSYFEFPHTRSYEGDLGFIIKRLDELNTAYNNFFEYNTIKFHDPIEWTIAETYPANNIVYDEQSETFYIAKQAVPAGIDISNNDYWILLTPFKTDTAFSANSINPIANKPVTNKFGIVDADINELNAALTAEITARTNSDNTLSTRINNNADLISSETSERTAADTLINARIDEIIEGASADPDAELIDIRVGGNGVTYNTAGNAVRGQYTDLNNKITVTNNVIGYSTTDFVDINSGMYEVTPDVQWLLKDFKFLAGNIITKLVFRTTSNDPTTVKIGFWTLSNNYLHRIYTSTYSGTPINKVLTFIKKIKLNLDCYISIECNNNNLRLGLSNDYKLINIPQDETDHVYSGGINYMFNCTITTMKTDLSMLEVEVDKLRAEMQTPAEYHVGPGLDYEEIQDAIEAVTGNYGVIIVHPKNGYYSRFSLMRSLTGTYPWGGLAVVPNISIIGMDKSKCIVKSATGDYDTPPAEIATNGTIANLTFVATHESSAGTETAGSYAVHVDNRPADANGMKLIFKNCDFISYQTAAVGLGLYRNQDISFIDCNFTSNTDSTWKPTEDYDSNYMCSIGAYFMHTAMGYNSGNMFVRFNNCILKHYGGTYAMRISDNDETPTAKLEAINNTLWDFDNENTGYHTTGTPIAQFPYNHGNNASELNA